MKKFKKDFRTWYLEQDYCILAIGEYGEGYVYRGFVALDFQFKWGVYLAFFDSVGIFVNTDRYYSIKDESHKNFYDWDVFYLDVNQSGYSDTREEAQKLAVEKAIEIYNGL